MKFPIRPIVGGMFVAATLSFAGGANAATCGGDYGSWLQAFKQEAGGKGVGARGVAALDGVTPDPAVLSKDRNQGAFNQTFEQFGPKRANALVAPGANKLRAMGSFFDRVESQTGVQGPVLISIWGLETSFGAVQGNFSTIRALATLAHDCRRSDRFRDELFNALKIVDSGAMTPASMRGAWAGEIGQTQFMPSSYLKFGGGQDLIHSSQAALMATANYLKGYGWSKGAGWEPGEANFAVIKEWNKSDVYARTIAYLATKINQQVK
jgi:lytic murein transglycosylase